MSMFKNECKKIFNDKNRNVFLIAIIIITAFYIYVLSNLTVFFGSEAWFDYISFGEFQSMTWVFGLIFVYIIILISVYVFPYEEKYDMLHLILTSELGRKTIAKAKLSLIMLVTNLVSVVYIVATLVGYYFAFEMDFSILITDTDSVLSGFTSYSAISTIGGLILLTVIGFIVTANFAALLSMFLSVKIKNTYLLCVLLFILFFFGITGIGFLTFLPISLYNIVATMVNVLFSIGAFQVTPHFISVIVTVVLIFLLLFKTLSIYKNGG